MVSRVQLGVVDAPAGLIQTGRVVFDALVPAWNEESTVSDVVRALRSAPSVRCVIVLDDASDDRTVGVAKLVGAEVFTHPPPNWGKGRLMQAGLSLTDTSHVGFFDADLLRFEPRHVERMAEVVRGGYDQVCGLRDYGILGAPAVLFPIITGERICTREMLDRVPWDCWTGYSIETAMNDTARRLGLRTACVILKGVRNRNKVSKVGWAQGLVRQTNMARQILGTRRALEATHGQFCTRCTESLERA
jgi:glycosyltransferase involved in cell wall biosynthesis